MTGFARPVARQLDLIQPQDSSKTLILDFRVHGRNNMTFTIYGLLSDDSPEISNESLAKDLKNYLQNEDNFSLDFETVAFSSGPTLALHWDAWLVRVSYEEGEEVEVDAKEMQTRTDSKLDFSRFKSTIRVIFGSDDEKTYTNEIIYILDYLRQIRGILIYDPQQNDFVK